MAEILRFEETFSRKKGQRVVAEFILRNGLRVSDDGKLLFKDIEIPYTSIAKVLDVDRRLIKETINTILKNPELKRVFTKLDSIVLLKNVAPELGFGAIEIVPTNASSKGIVANVTKIISDAGISARQITTDDPMFENAEMTIITEKPLPRKLIDKILNLPEIKKVVVLN